MVGVVANGLELVAIEPVAPHMRGAWTQATRADTNPANPGRSQDDGEE